MGDWGGGDRREGRDGGGERGTRGRVMREREVLERGISNETHHLTMGRILSRPTMSLQRKSFKSLYRIEKLRRSKLTCSITAGHLGEG